MVRACLLFGVILAAQAALGETIVVSPTGILTIQAAIDLAQTGDVVELLDGIYTGPGNRNLDLQGKAITIRSQSGNAAACVIDCEGSADTELRCAMHIHRGEGPQTVIEGLTLTGGYSGVGGGIYCESTSPTIRHCRFVANHAVNGGGLSAIGRPHVSDCLFADNVAGNMGGGGAAICSTSPPAALFERCTFVGNTSDLGGGIRV